MEKKTKTTCNTVRLFLFSVTLTPAAHTIFIQIWDLGFLNYWMRRYRTSTLQHIPQTYQFPTTETSAFGLHDKAPPQMERRQQKELSQGAGSLAGAVVLCRWWVVCQPHAPARAAPGRVWLYALWHLLTDYIHQALKHLPYVDVFFGTGFEIVKTWEEKVKEDPKGINRDWWQWQRFVKYWPWFLEVTSDNS